MRKFFRQAGYFFIIVTLLPYVITVFVNGNGVTVNSGSNSPYVSVERDGDTKKLLLNDYGIGVLAKEIDGTAGLEAIKAQAVLIRTSIYQSIEEEGSDTVLTKEYWTRNQMEMNWGKATYSETYDKFEQAWEDTDGQVLMYNGAIALTPYHKLSSGKTRSGNEVLGSEKYPYLKIKKCPKDVEAKEAMTTTMIQGNDMEVIKTDSAGYVTEVRCGKETVSGEEFRDTFHLASACFELQPFENQIRATTKGIGHGLGMSQYTAKQMAEEGKGFEEILQYFFEGTTLEEVTQIVTM